MVVFAAVVARTALLPQTFLDTVSSAIRGADAPVRGSEAMASRRESTAVGEQQQGAGYLVGDDVCALFAGALTFRERARENV